MEMTQISIDRLIKTKYTQTHNEKNSFFCFLMILAARNSQELITYSSGARCMLGSQAGLFHL